MTTPDKTRNYAYLYAESSTISLEKMQEILRLSPDETSRVGEPIPLNAPGGACKFNSWTLFAPVNPDDHFGLQSLTRWLESLSDDLANRFRHVAQLGVDVGLSIVQNVNSEDDIETQSSSTNFELSLKALRWLADSGTTLRIDQYLDIGHDPDAASLPAARLG